MTMQEYLLHIMVMFAVPLAPAYFLYNRLPSETVVKGPFKGFTVALSGAFAGYFLLVLIALGYLESAVLTRDGTYEQWKVSGRLKLSNTQGYEDPSSGDLVNILYFPSLSDVSGLTGGAYMSFSVDVPVWRSGNGTLNSLVDDLVFFPPNHQSTNFAFRSALQGGEVQNIDGSLVRYERNEGDHRIEIKDPIVPPAN